MADDRVLIVGLGNPGTKYEKTRHNAGFLAVDYFADDAGLLVSTEKMQGAYGVVRMAGKQVFVLKPMTYMNRSGESIAKYARYFSVETEHILVIHDDLDLEPGRIKIVSGGGAGGHNGIRSAVNHLGTNEFARLKIGIGRPVATESGTVMPVEKYVLSRFSAEQWQLFQENLDKVAEGIRLYINQGVEVSMNRINTRNRIVREP